MSLTKKIFVLFLLLVSIQNYGMDSQAKVDALDKYKNFKEFKPTTDPANPFHVDILRKEKAHSFIFDHVPSVLCPKVANFIEFDFSSNSENLCETLKALCSDVQQRFCARWTALGLHFNVVPYFVPSEQYFYFDQNEPTTTILQAEGRNIDMHAIFRKNVHTGQIVIARLKDFNKAKQEKFVVEKEWDEADSATKTALEPALREAEAMMEARRQLLLEARGIWRETGAVLEQQYQIHLMPAYDLTPAIIALLRALARNEVLQKSIAYFKAIVDTNIEDGKIMFNDHQVSDSHLSRIIIQPALGKKSAQYVLEEVYELFKHTKGLNETPDHTAKVTDMIYVSQGDMAFKVNPSYFKSGGIYYKPLTDCAGYYCLTDPKTGDYIAHTIA